MSGNQISIEPIDSFVLTGFQQRFQQVFGCKCAFINQNDKTKVLDRLFGEGNPLTYPYAWFVIQNISANHESYNSHPLGRRGITMGINSDSTYQTVRVMPTNFEIEVNYVTNKFQSVDQGSVLSFIRRWLLACRFGYLKTTVLYGNLQFGIGMTLNDSVPVPQRENITEAETKYDVVTTAVIHGYTSEPVLGMTGKVNKINLNEGVQEPNISGRVVSTQTFTFDRG